MRLHLPKGLLAAVFAAFLTFPIEAEEETTTQKTVTITAQAELTNASGSDKFKMTSDVAALGAGDLLIFNTSSGLYLPQTPSGASSVNMPMDIRIDQNLNITDGFKGTTYNFSGAISCAEAITATMNPGVINQTYNFSGSLANFKGTLSLNSNITANFNGVGTVGAKSISLAGTTTITGTFSTSGALINTGTLTNNGSLSIGGVYTGKTIQQGSAGSLSFNSGSVINLDQLNAASVYSSDSETGIHEYSRAYTIATSGSISIDNNAIYKVKNTEVTSGSLSDRVYTITGNYLNIATESNYSDHISETFDFIRVTENGSLVANTSVNHDLVVFGGTMKLGGASISYTGDIKLNQSLTITTIDSIDAADMTINGVISGSGGLIISGGVTATLGAANSFTGGITIQRGSTLKLSGAENKEYCGVGGNSVTVESGATFDLNGTHSQSRLPEVTLGGGTLSNTGSEIATGKKQLGDISLTANSEINAAANFGLIKSGHGAANLDLGSGNTLTKTGSATFYAAATTIMGTGTLKIEAGDFNFFKGANVLSDGVNVELAGGSLKVTGGTFTNNGTSTIFASKDGTVSGTITNSGTLKVAEVTGAEGKTVTFSGTISGGNVEASATTSIATLTGGGTLKSTAKTTTVTDASGFIGTLEATTGGSLSVKNASGLAALTADGGNIDILGTSSLSVADMVIGKGNTVGVYIGGSAPTTTPATAQEATLTITGSLTSDTGSKLNANLVLDGGTLTLNDTLHMGSNLTLNNNITLSGTAWNTWRTDTSEALTLFTGVDGLTINSQSAAENQLYDAADVFGNLTRETYSLKYTGAAAGGDVLLIANNPTPEPTTATLSLLALMGLAARRRRRKA